MNSMLRTIAHESLCLVEGPYLKHYRRGRFRLWNGVSFTASELPGAGFNFAAVLGPAPPFDEIVVIGHEFFADCAKGWGILVEADAGHPIEAELLQRGWAVDEDEPAYVLPHIEVANPAHPEFAIRHVGTAADEAAYYRITAAAFAVPPELAELMVPPSSFIGDPDVALFVGTCSGEDVAAAVYSRSGTTAVVAGVATLEPFRGRGFGAAITQAALAHAAANGCTSASLRSGPKSRPLYERLGFQYVCNHRTYAAPSS